MADALVVLRADELRELVTNAVSDALERLDAPREAPALIDKATLARALDCSTRTVDRLIADGLPLVRLGEAPRFRLDAVLAWLDARQPASGAESRGLRNGRKGRRS